MQRDILLCLIGLLIFTSCAESSAIRVSTERPSDVPEIEILATESTISGTSSSHWKSHTRNLGQTQSLRAVFFLNEKKGWTGGEGGKLYKTSDGGNTWQTINTEELPDASVRQIVFINDEVGWVVLQKDPPQVIDYDKSHARVIHTIDGGRNWQSQYEGKGVAITQLAFTDERNGWLTGIEYNGEPHKRYLLLRTSDQGKRWENASHELARIASINAKELNDGVMGVTFKEPATVTVITSDLRMFRTSDDGKSWAQIGSIQNKLGLTSVVRRLGVSDRKRLWSIGGTSGQSGTRGLLFAEQNERQWTKHVLNSVFFSDAISLEGGRFLACGFVMKTTAHGKSFKSHREGIILYSKDDGKNWLIVYQNPQVQNINMIAAPTKGTALAVGDHGLIIRLNSTNDETR